MTSVLDLDRFKNNILTRIETLERDLEQLKRTVPTGLFSGDSLQAPGDVNCARLTTTGRGVLNLLNLKSAVTLTIDSGEITITQGFHIVAAESGTSDNLDTINGGIEGDMLLLIADSGHTITVREVDNIQVGGTTDTLTDYNVELCIYDGTRWRCESFVIT